MPVVRPEDLRALRWQQSVPDRWDVYRESATWVPLIYRNMLIGGEPGPGTPTSRRSRGTSSWLG